jgi:ribonucleotide reductase alpha subunit
VKVTTVAPTGTIAKMPGVTEGIHPIYARYFIRRVRFSLADPEQVAKVEEFALQGFKVEEDVYDSSGNTAVVEFPTKDPLVAQIEELGLNPDTLVESADEISLRAMLFMQKIYQESYADNSVSFTVNIPAEPHQREALARGEEIPPPSDERVAEVAQTLIEFLPCLKGTTLMIDGSRPQAPYERITAEEYEAAEAKRIEDAIDLECATGACPVR